MRYRWGMTAASAFLCTESSGRPYYPARLCGKVRISAQSVSCNHVARPDLRIIRRFLTGLHPSPAICESWLQVKPELLRTFKLSFSPHASLLGSGSLFLAIPSPRGLGFVQHAPPRSAPRFAHLDSTQAVPNAHALAVFNLHPTQ